jgi:hypothetical protein
MITSAVPVVYAGRTLTIRGVNFDPLHQTCSCSLGEHFVEFCRILSVDTIVVAVAAASVPGFHAVILNFSNPNMHVMPLNSSHVQIMASPKIDSISPLTPDRAYRGSTVTVNGMSFAPRYQTCTVTLCGVAASRCTVMSTVAIEFVVDPSTEEGLCSAALQLQEPEFTLYVSIEVVMFPAINRTIQLPTRAYFGSLLKLHFNRLFSPPFLCFFAADCFPCVEFSESSATFKLPASESLFLTSNVSVVIRNPAVYIGTLSEVFQLSKGPRILTISSPEILPHPPSSFFIFGVDVWPPCKAKLAEGMRDIFNLAVINSTTISASWAVDPLLYLSQQHTESTLLLCYGCESSDVWCNSQALPGVFIFDLKLDDEDNVLIGIDMFDTQLHKASSVRPYSLHISPSAVVNVSAGDDVHFLVELLNSNDSIVVDESLLSHSAVFVTSSTVNDTKSFSAFYDGLSCKYNTKHTNSGAVSLQFEDLSLGGVSATYYRHEEFLLPVASGIQNSFWIGSRNSIFPRAHSFRMMWFFRGELNGG